MPGALVAFTIKLIFFALRAPTLIIFSAPIPVPVANTAPLSLLTNCQLVILLPDSRTITVLNVTALPHFTDTRWLLVPLATDTVAVLPSRTNLVLSKPEPSAPALGPVTAKLEPRVCACTVQASKLAAAPTAKYWPTRRVIGIKFMLITLLVAITLLFGLLLWKNKNARW